MPSSIQTSPPAMHRRSLHPNRIYPAINGLDPLAQTDGGAVLKLLPRNTICHSSRNGSSGATPRGEGKTAPKGDISRRCPAHRAWTARGTPNPGADPTHGASVRCPVDGPGRGLASPASKQVDWAQRGFGLLIRDGIDPLTRATGTEQRRQQLYVYR